MHRFRSRRSRGYHLDQGSVEMIIQLWLLRLLVPLECHRQLLTMHGIENEEIAALLGIVVEDDKVDDIEQEFYDPALYRLLLKQRLKALEKKVASIELPDTLARNINQLADQVGLSEVECWILAFAVLIRTDRMLDDAADWLGSDLNSLKVYHVLAVVLGFSETEIRDALSANSTLTKTGLVVLDRHHRSPLGRKLDVLSSHFADRLLSESGSPFDWLRDMIVPSHSPQLTLADYPHLQETLDYLLPYLQQSIIQGRTGVNIFLHGAPGTGKTQLVRVLAEALKVSLYEIASEDIDGDPVVGEQRLRAFRAAQCFFQQNPSLLMFDEVEDIFHNSSFGAKSTAQVHKAWMNRLLEQNTSPTFWLGNRITSIDPAFIRRFDWVIELPVPPKSQRERIIRQNCGDVLIEPAIQRLAACEELAPAVVNRAAKVIGCLRDEFPREKLSTALQNLMDKTLIAQGHPGLSKMGACSLPEYYDPELVNCDVDLKEIAAGVERHGSARICLFGPPGTGKTAYSHWLAKQLERPLHVKRGADLLSMYVGGTEQNIARIFDEAEQDQAVLLIDEVDSFLQDRNTSRYSWEVTGVNEMLTRMEAYNGVFIASTNRLEGLDSAAIRRFDLKVRFDVLKPKQSWQLLQSYCQSLGLPEPDSEAQLALQKLEGLTPGDFAVLARQHKFRPLTNIQALLGLLSEECCLKQPYRRQPIGFV